MTSRNTEERLSPIQDIQPDSNIILCLTQSCDRSTSDLVPLKVKDNLVRLQKLKNLSCYPEYLITTVFHIKLSLFFILHIDYLLYCHKYYEFGNVIVRVRGLSELPIFAFVNTVVLVIKKCPKLNNCVFTSLSLVGQMAEVLLNLDNWKFAHLLYILLLTVSNSSTHRSRHNY